CDEGAGPRRNSGRGRQAAARVHGHACRAAPRRGGHASRELGWRQAAVVAQRTNGSAADVADASEAVFVSGGAMIRAACRGRSVRSQLIVAVAFLVGCLVGAKPAESDVKLPTLFSSHVVMQRDLPLPVWGWAAPGEKVTVTIAGQTRDAIAGGDGKWRVTL